MTKKLEQEKTTSTDYVSQEDLFRGEGLHELVSELKKLDEQHVQQLEYLDSRYEDICNGQKYIMHRVYDFNKDELAIMRRKAELLKKINRILERAIGEFTDVGA